MRRTLTVLAVTGGILAGAAPALAHQPGMPAQAGRLAGCSDARVNITARVGGIGGVATKRVVKVGTRNRAGRHQHIGDWQVRTVRGGNVGPWRTVANDKVTTCGTAPVVLAPSRGIVNLAGVAWKLRTVDTVASPTSITLPPAALEHGLAPLHNPQLVTSGPILAG